MRKPTKLPDIALVESNFTYDPASGQLFTKTGKQVSSWDRSTNQMKVRVGQKQTTVQRLCWYLYYRKDPIHHKIIHLDGNPRNNCIDNLRAVKL